MESWDWSQLSNVQVEFRNTTTIDADNEWTVNLCENVYSNLHDYGSFTGGSGSIKFHQPSDTFYMMFENGDKGDGCESDPRQSDVYIHCQGCPSYLSESNPACTLQSSPCICAAYDAGCIGEVHMAANCPVGNPKILFQQSISHFNFNREPNLVLTGNEQVCRIIGRASTSTTHLRESRKTSQKLLSRTARSHLHTTFDNL